MNFLQDVIHAPMLVKLFIAAAIFVFAYVLYAFAFSKSTPENKSPFLVRYKVQSGKPVDIDIKRGLAIFGASGAGKSRSGFLPIFKTAKENGISLLTYDYKDFELTECVNFFYRDSGIPVHTISPARPEFSHCCNPMHTDYIKSFDDMNVLAGTLISNLGTDPKGDAKFFSEAAESAFAGVGWRLKEDYPQHCHIPMAVSIIMGKDPGGLYDFISKSQYASLLGKTFLDSAVSEKQLAAVMGTLSAALRKIISPQIFMIFSKNDFDLAINKGPAVLNVVNHPKYDTLLAPFLATVIQSSLTQMSERGRNPAYFSIDEASTIKINKMERIPATLRSYDIGTIFGLQDKIQGVDVYGENKLKAILTNLGAKLLGKANDADTAEYYQKLFELIEVEQVSFSKGTGLLANAEMRENISTKEKSKHRAHEFYKLSPGDFFVFDDKGSSHKVKFKAEECQPVKSKIVNDYSQTELEVNFKKILDIGRSLE
jgi:type IV secretory pathway TraG/TraD family ATPase VirD4